MAEPDVPAGDGYDTSPKIALLLFKEKIDKPLRKLEDHINETPGIFEVSGIGKSRDYTSFSKWNGDFRFRRWAACSAETLSRRGSLERR